ncbi:hypothetical protein V3W47_02545 [Deinococcus sp. YIM 134068]|uniref:hypothetical protein n=1 Tax=Deinococcus lichenicola TaxID=3118910 RepID=UPI002F92B941
MDDDSPLGIHWDSPDPRERAETLHLLSERLRRRREELASLDAEIKALVEETEWRRSRRQTAFPATPRMWEKKRG